jgi:glycine cleavage system aminomethyltransferase T
MDRAGWLAPEYLRVVSVSTYEPEPLESVVRRAGAVISTRAGRPVAIHYGSAAGELAVCIRAVGLVDRSDLSKLLISAPAPQLRDLAARALGRALEPGQAVREGGCWWCGDAPEQLVIIAGASAGPRLREQLRAAARSRPTIVVGDRSEQWAAIEVAGRATSGVLDAIGAACGSPPGGRFVHAAVGGVDISWLLESEHRALAIVPARDAGSVWHAIEQAGRPLGISCVGSDAADRYALLDARAPCARA